MAEIKKSQPENPSGHARNEVEKQTSCWRGRRAPEAALVEFQSCESKIQ
ncbi:unnamed protein product [Cuscuta europaea]|uniref:Uncharacterized protein n=1 Tax=Cuscuta europaea TaxID=41803 RepID=A0A9P1DZE6_CUSEU|nr:unnamed protein product [Cuscuta europaea]